MNNQLLDSRISLINETTTDIGEKTPLFIIKLIVDEYLSFLNRPFTKTASKIIRDQTQATIITEYYGLKERAFSVEEIALLQGISEGRVRQIITAFDLLIYNVITGRDINFAVNENYRLIILSFYKILLPYKVVSLMAFENEVLFRA